MLPQPKIVTAITPVSVTNGATATGGNIDTLGFRHCAIAIVTTTADVVSNKPSVLKVQESTTTDATNYGDITGAVGGTDFTVANAITTGENNYLFQLAQLGTKRKRYLRALYSPRTTQVVAGVAYLTRGEEAPYTAAKANVLNLVEL